MEAKSRTQKDAGLSRNGRQGSDSSFPISKGGCDLSMSVRIKPGAFAPDKLAQRLPFQRALAVPALAAFLRTAAQMSLYQTIIILQHF